MHSSGLEKSFFRFSFVELHILKWADRIAKDYGTPSMRHIRVWATAVQFVAGSVDVLS